MRWWCVLWLGWTSAVGAADQCPANTNCEAPTEAAAVMRAEIDALPQSCARLDVEHATQYARLLAATIEHFPQDERVALQAA